MSLIFSWNLVAYIYILFATICWKKKSL
jgi:hypothetical protein